MRTIKDFYWWNGHTESAKLHFFDKVVIFSFFSGISTFVNQRAICIPWRITEKSLLVLVFLLKYIHNCCLELISLQNISAVCHMGKQVRATWVYKYKKYSQICAQRRSTQNIETVQYLKNMPGNSIPSNMHFIAL